MTCMVLPVTLYQRRLIQIGEEELDIVVVLLSLSEQEMGDFLIPILALKIHSMAQMDWQICSMICWVKCSVREEVALVVDETVGGFLINSASEATAGRRDLLHPRPPSASIVH